LRQKAAIEGERKHVTVLFADLADSSALAEGIDAEEMHGLMDRAFKIILAEIHRFEGTVNQFTGDGVMALFGAPIALEDAPRCAVRAALGIQKALAPMDAEVARRYDRGFRMRIGINTGPVVVGRIGNDLRMDYTAVGDTTNLAARLEQGANAGEVVISETTARQVEGFFDLRALEPTKVKGRGALVNAHLVLSERRARGRIDALAESDFTPYVGREAQLDALMRAFDDAKNGRGHVAFVVGEAGIGKSRLLYEFENRLAGVPHSRFSGQCTPYTRTTPFHAIADGLRRRFGIDDRDDETSATRKLDAFEEQAGSGLEWTLPFVRYLLSLPTQSPEVDAMDAMTRRVESCRALQARILRAAQPEPLVLVIEDLHWIDTATEEFLSFLVDSIPAAPVLVVLTHRPGYEHPFGDRSFHVRIPLQPLAPAAMTDMLRALLECADLPIGLEDLVERKAEGNPLFVEEIARSLMEEGVIQRDGKRLVLARDVADITVPDRIQDVLMARLDRLAEGPKRAIQIASVIGREFALRLLARITEAGDELEPIVGELRALELILQKTAHPELAYMFKHALTHEVAYESVLVHRRKALHRLVGSTIEELYGDRIAEHYEALAYHFGQAEQWASALRYHELASEKSSASYANHAAAEHCREALAIAGRLGGDVSDERRLALAGRLAAACFYCSEFRASAEAFELAASLTDDPGQRAVFMGRASFSHLWNHDYDRSEATQVEAEDLAIRHGSAAGRVFSFIARNEFDVVHGRRLDEEAGLDAALELAERSGDPLALVACLSQAGQRVQWLGDYRRAISLCERAVGIAMRERIPGDALSGQWFLGISLTAIGEYGRGLEVLMGALEISDRVGDRAVKARLANTIGWCHSEFGCHIRAAEYNRVGAELAREMVELGLVAGAPELYANAVINLAGNHTALGDLDSAAEQLAVIEPQLGSELDRWMQWRYSLHLLHGQARVLLAAGDPERAVAKCELEHQGAVETHARKMIARSLELKGRALLVMDRRDEAEAALRRALQVARELEYPPATWRALSLLGELSRRRGHTRQAGERFHEAKQLVRAKAPSVPSAELRSEFLKLAEALESDPLGAHR
jgi:class 3 adenylate cyclase/tetratricopeptide (TPR) repeat protein